MENSKPVWSEIRSDVPAGIAVFLVSVPLCLGVALASGAPLLSGLIAGITGGIVCGMLSRSPVSITGPAAGLSAVALHSIADLGSFSLFLIAVVLAGIIQIILGLAKTGAIARLFPVSVIKGMLAGIGLILVFKQIPHALGYDANVEGDETFLQADNENTFTEIFRAFGEMSAGAVLISVVSFVLMIVLSSRKASWLRWLPGPLAVVIAGVVINEVMLLVAPQLGLQQAHLVSLPHISEWTLLPDALGSLTSSNLTQVIIVAITIAAVASIESLLNIEAIDKLDPYRRITPLNRELVAQGTTNVVSGMLGGLPVTAVIVRSSLNLQAGAKTQMATITQASLLAVSFLAFPSVLERIPLACLAIILIVTGYKLTRPSLWQKTWLKGIDQFAPFMVTALTILFTDLLTGVILGLAVAVLFVLKSNFRMAILQVNRENHYMLKFTKDVSFFNKPHLYKLLEKIPAGSHVFIDGTRSHFIDQDIIEMLEDFERSAPLKRIKVEIVKKNYAVHPYFKTEQTTT